MNPTLTLEIPFVLLGRKDIDTSRFVSKEERRTAALDDIHATLHNFCSDIKVALIDSSDHIKPDVAWHLFPSPLDEDAVLDVDERIKLGKNIWSCPAMLQRSGIPIDTAETTWALFLREAAQIFDALGKMDKHKEPETVHGEVLHLRIWSLVAPSQAQLRLSLVPARTAAILHLHLIKRVLVLFAALERELTLLTTPAALLKYWSLSRFLELRAIRQLGQEKAHLWTKLRDKTDWTEQRKSVAYAKEKRKWFGRFDEEDRASERTKGRRREWWDVIDSADMQELMVDMNNFLANGRSLGIQPAIDVDGDGDGDAARTKVTALSFQAHHSTLDATHIVAYTKLIASLAHMACDFTHAQLSTWLLDFRQNAPSHPRQSFDKLLGSLHISAPSMSFWNSYLDTFYPSLSSSSCSSPTEPSPRAPSSSHHSSSPFSPLTSHISHTLSSQLSFLPTFHARYTAASGFYPTPTSKLYALLMADEHAQQRTRTTRGDEDWLEGIKDKVGVGEGKDVEEDLEGRPARSPGGVGGVEWRRGVREGLYR